MIATNIAVHDLAENGALAFDLPDILALLDKPQLLDWFVLDLEAVGNLPGQGSMVEFEKQISNSKHGIRLDWKALSDLAAALRQTINLTLVGVQPHGVEPSMPLQRDSESEIVIEAVDSSYWVISTRDQELIKRIQHRFKDTRLEAGGPIKPSPFSR